MDTRKTTRHNNPADMLICIAFGLGTALALISAPQGADDNSGFVATLTGMPILIAFAGMALARLFAEPTMRRIWFRPGGMFSPKTQSWAFLFGDFIGLPVALWAAGASVGDWLNQYHTPWLAVSMFVGVAITAIFHRSEVKNYTASGNADRLSSPTRMWHGGVVYPSLVTLLVYFGGPAVWFNFTSYGWIVLLGIGFWLTMGVADIIRKLDPAMLHPRVQDTRLG